MNKKTSMVLTATIVTILAGVLVTVYAQSAFAQITITNTGGNGGNGGIAGNGGNGGAGAGSDGANGGNAHGGNGGDAIVIFSDSCIRANCWENLTRTPFFISRKEKYS